MLKRSIILVAAVLWCAPAWAQTHKLIGKFRDWEAYTFKEKKAGRTCFMTSLPLTKKPEKVKHGDVYVMVTHWPKAKIQDEVSINVGFTFKAKSEVSLAIGKRSHKMYTSVDSAWGYEAKDDRRLVKAMRAGDEMIVKGVSARGTKVTYRFSLSGFTAAYMAISKTCKVK